MGCQHFIWMWFLPPINGPEVTTQVLLQSLLSASCTGFVKQSLMKPQPTATSPSPSRLIYHVNGAGGHNGTCEVSRWWAIRLKEPVVQSPAVLMAGGMRWWKDDEVLHQEQNTTMLAGCLLDGRHLGRKGPRNPGGQEMKCPCNREGSSRKRVASRSMEVIVHAPLFGLSKTTCGVVSSLGSPVWGRQWGDTKVVRGWSTWCMRKVESMVLVQPGEEKVKGGANLTADFSYLMGGGRGNRLFSDMYNKRMRGNRRHL